MAPAKTFNPYALESDIIVLAKEGREALLPDYMREVSMIAIRHMETLAEGGAPYPLPDEWGGTQRNLNGVLACFARRAADITVRECAFANDRTVEDVANDITMETLYNIGYGGATNMHVRDQRIWAR